MQNKLITVGKIVGVHGVKGYLVVKSYTEPHTNILNYADWWWKSAGDWKKIPKVKATNFGKKIVMQLEQITDRDVARQYVGLEITIRRTDLPSLAENQYYWNDLQGLVVINQQQKNLGVISHLIATGANDVLVVKTVDNKEQLIPYINEQVVLTVDLNKQQMLVNWDENF